MNMRKSLLTVGAFLVLGASVASAQGGAGAINLSWNDCGAAGVADNAFLCNTNSGPPFIMVASFVAPGTLPEFLGLSAQIDVKTADPTLPAWWQHGNMQCRSTTGLSTDFNFVAGPFSCLDFFAGAAAGGFAYDIGFGTPDRGRLRVQCAVPFDNRNQITTADGEYYAFKAVVTRGKTTGAGSCDGCLLPGCLVLNEVQLFQPPAQQNDPVITTPGNRNYVTWQTGTGTNCPQSTPTRTATWGQVKSLYR
jgi:hypothetical protein